MPPHIGRLFAPTTSMPSEGLEAIVKELQQLLYTLRTLVKHFIQSTQDSNKLSLWLNQEESSNNVSPTVTELLERLINGLELVKLKKSHRKIEEVVEVVDPVHESEAYEMRIIAQLTNDTSQLFASAWISSSSSESATAIQ